MTLAQTDTHQRFLTLERGGWTTVCESWYVKGDSNGGIYCALAQPAVRADTLSHTGWDLMKSDFRPGFMQRHEDGGRVTTYQPSGSGENYEPLVLLRNFNDVVPEFVEIDQEFRLFHNLFWDPLTSQFMQAGSDGTSTAAVKITDNNKVEIRTKLLRQYQAARQLDLVLFIDSVCLGTADDELPEPADWVTGEMKIELIAANMHRSKDEPFTRYLGKRVLPPPPVEKSGIWPFDEEDEDYPEFIINIDDDGDEITYSCNDKALGNYFGANPDAPHYLTPVHFQREVLRKYYDKPELYTVSDGRLSCASLWGISIDNSAPDTVVVFLGDLGRDLPSQERGYWRSFNVAPDHEVSETLIRRSFLGQFAEPEAIDLQFRYKYVALGEAWSGRHGWELHRKPADADAVLLQRLRLPLDHSQAEFEASVQIMTKLLVDALNESAIQKLLPGKVDGEKGIAKLERWLTQEGYPHVARDIQFLRQLQSIRSQAVAHWKGSSYDKSMTKTFGSARGRAAMEQFFASALAMMTGLEEWAMAAAAPAEATEKE